MRCEAIESCSFGPFGTMWELCCFHFLGVMKSLASHAARPESGTQWVGTNDFSAICVDIDDTEALADAFDAYGCHYGWYI